MFERVAVFGGVDEMGGIAIRRVAIADESKRLHGVSGSDGFFKGADGGKNRAIMRDMIGNNFK